jgi:hypothetical protein
MHTRCGNSNHKDWHHYGGRGIRVCQRWSQFKHFLADMGERPQGCTLDRLDHAKNYTPSNCRWATPLQQQENKRANRGSHMLTYQGRTMSMANWARELQMLLCTLHFRIKHGWSTAKALTTPLKGKQ